MRIKFLFDLARSGDVGQMRMFLDPLSPAQLTTQLAQTENGDSILNVATKRDHLEVVRLLLDKGCDINGQAVMVVGSSPMSSGPLHCAAREGLLSMCSFLLSNGAHVNGWSSDEYRFTPLHLASARGHSRTVSQSNGIGRRLQKERRRRRTMAIQRTNGQPQWSSSSVSSEVCPSSSKLPNSSGRATFLDSEKALSLEEMRELNKLATLLPPSLRVLNAQSNAAQLVLNASHYIAQLTATVFARVGNGTLLEGIPIH